MAEIQCFLIEPTGTYQVYLRRYSASNQDLCPGPYKYHNAIKIIGEKEQPAEDKTRGLRGRGGTGEDPPHDDQRWPSVCSYCSYVFTAADRWQDNEELLYIDPRDPTKKFLLRDAPLGAMWNSEWMNHSKEWSGPDGKSWTVQTPGGEWCIDGVARDGGKWTRTGTAPILTVKPSILIGTKYHGFLTNGKLTNC